MDHFWDLEAVLTRDLTLTILVPSTLSILTLKFIFGGAFEPASTWPAARRSTASTAGCTWSSSAKYSLAARTPSWAWNSTACASWPSTTALGRRRPWI